MKKTFPLLFIMLLIMIVPACAPQETITPVPPPATEPAVATPTPVPPTPAQVEQSADWKPYTNTAFGLSFQFPSAWYGPDEYVSDQTLRLSVGSDVVYPYGTDRTEQIYQIKDSYYVVIQYSKNDQNQYWKEIYQSLVNLPDGEMLSDGRGLLIKVRQLDLGRFQGVEYISTLAETAQTEPVYSRQVILFDDQSNLLTVTGAPNNVEDGSGPAWRNAYQKIDQANQMLFHQMVESIVIE